MDKLIDKYIAVANKNARYASEIGLIDSMKMHQYYRDLFKELKVEEEQLTRNCMDYKLKVFEVLNKYYKKYFIGCLNDYTMAQLIRMIADDLDVDVDWGD